MLCSNILLRGTVREVGNRLVEIVKIRQALTQAGIISAALDARLLMQHVLAISHEELLGAKDITLTEAQQNKLNSLLARRIKHEPMAHLLGRREFWGMEFEVTPDTLIPRPDSETLIETLITLRPERSKPLQILDLGVGSGCLLLSALSEYPLASGLGIDRNPGTLAVASRNAVQLGLENRTKFEKCDWNNGIKGVWDVVLGNPPYIPTEEIPKLSEEVVRYEPTMALDGGEDGLDCYRAIISFLPTILAEDGCCLLEIGQRQASDVVTLVEGSNLKATHVTRDIAGIERCIVIQHQH